MFTNQKRNIDDCKAQEDMIGFISDWMKGTVPKLSFAWQKILPKICKKYMFSIAVARFDQVAIGKNRYVDREYHPVCVCLSSLSFYQ